MRDGGGMFASRDQYRVVPGNGHEIIDRIRCLTLGPTLVVRCPIVRSILNPLVPYNDSSSASFFDSAGYAVLDIPICRFADYSFFSPFDSRFRAL